MAFDITLTAQALQTHLQGSDLFASVDIGRPNSPVGDGPSARITIDSMRVVDTVLNAAIELHVLKVKIYLGAYSFGEQSRELQASTLTSEVLDLLYEDFTLGGRVRNVDIGGQYGSIEVDFVDEETTDQPTHVADITVPIIVDSSTVFVA